MKLENCKRKKVEKTTDKTQSVCIRITKDVSQYLRKNDLSPTGIFNEALKELGYKNGKSKI